MLGPCSECGKTMEKKDSKTARCKKCNIDVPIFNTDKGWCECASGSIDKSHYAVWDLEGINRGWVCNSCGCLTQAG